MQCSYEQAVKIAADSIDKLRVSDVYRLLDWYPQLDGFPQWIKDQRPDLSDEVDSVLKEMDTKHNPTEDTMNQEDSMADEYLEHDQELPVNDFIFEHLAQYVHHHIKEEHQQTFLAYAMDQLHSYGNDWANIGWSVLYGRFLMKP